MSLSISLPSLNEFIVFSLLSIPASVIATFLANYLLGQEVSLTESIVEFIIRTIIFYLLLCVTFVIATLTLGSGLFG